MEVLKLKLWNWKNTLFRWRDSHYIVHGYKMMMWWKKNVFLSIQIQYPLHQEHAKVSLKKRMNVHAESSPSSYLIKIMMWKWGVISSHSNLRYHVLYIIAFQRKSECKERVSWKSDDGEWLLANNFPGWPWMWQ